MTADTTPESPSEYTPTTEEVRIKYTLSSGRLPEAPAEFDRWLAAHDAEVARKALTDAADAMPLYLRGTFRGDADSNDAY